eukprot:gene12473-biopygen9187
MGYKLSPELMQLLCSTLAGLPSCVPPALRAPDHLRIDIWIDNIRLCGAENSVSTWGRVIQQRRQLAQVTFGEVEHFAQLYTFIGVCFNHVEQSVCVGDKALGNLKVAPKWTSMTIQEAEAFSSRTLYAAAILGVKLFRYYHFYKCVRKALSDLNRGVVKDSALLYWTPQAIAAGTDLRERLERNTPRLITPLGGRFETVLMTDASDIGWGAVLFMGSGAVHITGSRWFEEYDDACYT